MQLSKKISELKQETNTISSNPLLNNFEENYLQEIDNTAVNDNFIKEKKSNILNLIKEIGIDFDDKLISAYNEYSEAVTYLILKSKFYSVERVLESSIKTPDYKIQFAEDNQNENSCTIYAELKSLSFASGKLNYIKAMEQALDSSIDIVEQKKQGKKVAFGVSVIQPFKKFNKPYDSLSLRSVIEIINEKINQNIKKDQYCLGETILIIDLKQLQIPQNFKESAVPVYQENMYNSPVSGILWNVCFGKVGDPIYKFIEFEGSDNIEGSLNVQGILNENNYIKAIVFLIHPFRGGTPKISGLYKTENASHCLDKLLSDFCDFINDEKNTSCWELAAKRGNNEKKT